MINVALKLIKILEKSNGDGSNHTILGEMLMKLSMLLSKTIIK